MKKNSSENKTKIYNSGNFMSEAPSQMKVPQKGAVVLKGKDLRIGKGKKK